MGDTLSLSRLIMSLFLSSTRKTKHSLSVKAKPDLPRGNHASNQMLHLGRNLSNVRGFAATLLKSAIICFLFAVHAMDAAEETSGHRVMNRLQRCERVTSSHLIISRHRRLCGFTGINETPGCDGVDDGSPHGDETCTKCSG